MTLGMIVRMDPSGLGNQTRAICNLLKPNKLMIIDSRPFRGKDTPQHPEWYEGYSSTIIHGFPTISDCNKFIRGLTHIFTCETPYNYSLYGLARVRGVKLFNQYNYEYLDNLVQPNMAKPYRFISPSTWYLDEMRQLFPDTVHLPTPIFPSEYKDSRDTNLKRSGKRKFVLIVGKAVTKDRSGLLNLFDALPHSKADYQISIRTQEAIPEYMSLSNDNRIIWDINNIENHAELYKDADAMLHPRRFGGQSMLLNEALVSGLPTIMPNIPPQDSILPPEWLVEATATDKLQTRVLLDVYTTNPIKLAEKIDWLATMPENELTHLKYQAYELGLENFSADKLRDSYKAVLEG